MSRAGPRDERILNDAYYTPATAIAPIYAVISSYARSALRIWDPAAGNNDIVRYFAERGIDSVDSDIVSGHDFLDASTHKEILEYYLPIDAIITNPPYNLAEEFVTTALDLMYSKNNSIRLVAMLLRLNFLGSQKRHDWWQTRLPNTIIALSCRPSFTNDGKTDATDYAWFVWLNDFIGFRAFPAIQVAWGGEYE